MRGAFHRIFKLGLIGVALLACVWSLAATPVRAQQVKRVLLLNAYSHDLSWTADITRGVQEVMSGQGASVKLSVEFMDTKNYFSPEYLAMVEEQLRLKYGHIKLDAVITSDDNAINFALQNRARLFGNTPIIFCGVNNLDLPKRDDFKNITGVLESPDVGGSIEAAMRLQPGLKTIYLVMDSTTTGAMNKGLTQAVLPKYEDKVGFVWLENLSMSELKGKVSSLPPDSAVLLVTFNRDRLGQWFTFEECIAELSPVSNSPIYSMWDFYLGHGIVGGMLTSGRYQGVTAANMALEVMSGTPTGEVPVTIQKANRYMFDYAMLTRYGLYRDMLPEGSILINVPESLYDKYKYELWFVSGIIVLLSVAIIALLANIRARKKAEGELEELNKYQETLIEQRTEELTLRSRELELANYELKKLDSLKTAVLNTVSHDLRTPLTAVLGFCKIIDRDFKRFFLPLCHGADDLEGRGERIRGNLTIIEKEGERLTRLINDFLDLSKIESGSMGWNDQMLEPTTLFKDAIPVFQGYFTGSEVGLSVQVDDGLPRVLADPDRLLQVLNNLVGNAAKFTHAGKVSIEAVEANGCLQVTVADTGVGIPTEELEDIFEKFYQVAQSTSDTEICRGSGMGLAISKHIVEHYGGSIRADSTPERGSRFTFTLPPAAN